MLARYLKIHFSHPMMFLRIGHVLASSVNDIRELCFGDENIEVLPQVRSLIVTNSS